MGVVMTAAVVMVMVMVMVMVFLAAQRQCNE